MILKAIFVAIAISCHAEAEPRIINASFYGWSHQGKLMANTKRFDCRKMTCASWDYKLGTRLIVRGSSGRAVVVTVTDRGPAKRLLKTRQIDLSLAAFRAIGNERDGITPVAVEVVR